MLSARRQDLKTIQDVILKTWDRVWRVVEQKEAVEDGSPHQGLSKSENEDGE